MTLFQGGRNKLGATMLVASYSEAASAAAALQPAGRKTEETVGDAKQSQRLTCRRAGTVCGTEERSVQRGESLVV